MDTEGLKTVLEDAGLSPYQAKAYVAALELGTASATELAEASGVPDPRIYDVVRALEEHRYVETYEHDTLRVRAHSPADVLEDLRTRAAELEAAAEEIEDRWEQPELESHTASVVKRFDTVLDRARLFIEEATDQIQLSATPEQFEVLRPALEAAHERGVHIHLSIHTHPEETEPPPPSEAELAGACTEARHRRLPSPFVALVDRSKACFSPHALESGEYGVLVDDRVHEYVFHWYFLTCLWELSEPIYTARDDEPPVAYIDIRQYIRDVEPLVREGATVTTRIEGYFTATGDHRELVGTVTDIQYEGEVGTDDQVTPLAQLAGRATLTLDTGSEEYTVGGWGATLEQVEATRITTERIEYPDGRSASRIPQEN